MEERTFLWLFYVVLLIAVFLSLSIFMHDNFVEDKAYKHKFLSKDISLAHDTLATVNGEVIAELDLLEKYNVVLDKTSNCEVVVEIERSNCLKNMASENKRYFFNDDRIVINNIGGVYIDGKSS